MWKTLRPFYRAGFEVSVVFEKCLKRVKNMLKKVLSNFFQFFYDIVHVTAEGWIASHFLFDVVERSHYG